MNLPRFCFLFASRTRSQILRVEHGNLFWPSSFLIKLCNLAHFGAVSQLSLPHGSLDHILDLL